MYESGSRIKDIASTLCVSFSTVIKYTRGVKRNPKLPDDIEGEKWVDIAGYEGIYSISDHGRVFCHGGYHRKCGIKYAGRSGSNNPDGKCWFSVILTDGNGKTRTYKVHRLVADAFVPGRTEERNQVNHIDGNPENNVYSNLEWVTQSENLKHAYRVIGRKTNNHRKLTPDQVRAIRKDPRGCGTVAKEYGVGANTIKEIRQRKRYADVA